MSDSFPLPIDPLLASMTEVLKQKGAALEIAVLVNASAKGYVSNYDNWNGGTYGYTLNLDVPPHVYGLLSEDDRKAAEATLRDMVSVYFRGRENESVDAVLIRPALPEEVDGSWRQSANDWLRGAGITNQGRVRSNNIAAREHDGLLFRSDAEIRLYKALKAQGVTFAPLPVFLRGGKDYARLEPDFLVIKDGIVVIVEVDGDTHFRETAAEAQARLVPMEHEGVKVVRLPVAKIETDEQAAKVARYLAGEWFEKQRRIRA